MLLDQSPSPAARSAASATRDEAPQADTFTAIGCEHMIVACRPDALDDALHLARSYLSGLDRAASRFRPDSELSRLNTAARTGDVTAVVSSQLARTLAAALRVARLTSGLVDPTVGAALEAAGYDSDLDAVRARTAHTPHPRWQPTPAPGWTRIQLDPSSRLLTMPAGTVLDVGASAKAMAADHVATMLSAALPGGFVVNFGGDIAIGGDLPVGGWQLGVDDSRGRTVQVVTSHGQALATSSIRHRTWRTEAGVAHHIIDPATGAVAEPVWAQVTCCAATALEANAASTAALVLGGTAPAWLHAHGLAALLLPLHDSPALRVGGWPVADRQGHITGTGHSSSTGDRFGKSQRLSTSHE